MMAEDGVLRNYTITDSKRPANGIVFGGRNGLMVYSSRSTDFENGASMAAINGWVTTKHGDRSLHGKLVESLPAGAATPAVSQTVPDNVDRFTAPGRHKDSITVSRDPAVGWVAESGGEMNPITEAEANAYWRMRNEKTSEPTTGGEAASATQKSQVPPKPGTTASIAESPATDQMIFELLDSFNMNVYSRELPDGVPAEVYMFEKELYIDTNTPRTEALIRGLAAVLSFIDMSFSAKHLARSFTARDISQPAFDGIRDNAEIDQVEEATDMLERYDTGIRNALKRLAFDPRGRSQPTLVQEILASGDLLQFIRSFFYGDYATKFDAAVANKERYAPVTADQALDSAPHYRALNDLIESHGFLLGGSMALREHGTVYRDASELMHDWDIFYANRDPGMTPQERHAAGLEALSSLANDLVTQGFTDTFDFNAFRKWRPKKIHKASQGRVTPRMLSRFAEGQSSARVESSSMQYAFNFLDQTGAWVTIDSFMMVDEEDTTIEFGKHLATNAFAAKATFGRHKDAADLYNYAPYPKKKAPIEERAFNIGSFDIPKARTTASVGASVPYASLIPGDVTHEQRKRYLENLTASADAFGLAMTDKREGVDPVRFMERLRDSEHTGQSTKLLYNAVIDAGLAPRAITFNWDMWTKSVRGVNAIATGSTTTGINFYRSAVLANTPKRLVDVMTHELLHTLTSDFIELDPGFRASIESLRVRVEAEIERRKTTDSPYTGRTYGLTNEHEFISEAFSNGSFQRLLAEIPSPNRGGGVSSLWHDFITLVKRGIAKYLGESAPPVTVLEDVISQVLSRVDMGIQARDANVKIEFDPFVGEKDPFVGGTTASLGSDSAAILSATLLALSPMGADAAKYNVPGTEQVTLISHLIDHLKLHEGLREVAYAPDPNRPERTIGYGHNLIHGDNSRFEELTGVSVEAALAGTPITKEAAERVLRVDAATARTKATRAFPDEMARGSVALQNALTDAYFWSIFPQFKKAKAAVEAGNWDEAADELIDSELYDKHNEKRGLTYDRLMKMIAVFRTQRNIGRQTMSKVTPSLGYVAASRDELINQWAWHSAEYGSNDLASEAQIKATKKIIHAQFDRTLRGYKAATTYEDAEEVVMDLQAQGIPRRAAPGIYKNLLDWALYHLPPRQTVTYRHEVVLAPERGNAELHPVVQQEFKFAPEPDGTRDALPLIYGPTTASLAMYFNFPSMMLDTQLREGVPGVFRAHWEEANYMSAMATRESHFYDRILTKWGLGPVLQPLVEQEVPIRDADGNPTGETRTEMRPTIADNLRGKAWAARVKLTEDERQLVSLVHLAAKMMLEHVVGKFGERPDFDAAMRKALVITGIRVSEMDTLSRAVPKQLAEIMLAAREKAEALATETGSSGKDRVNKLKYARELERLGVAVYRTRATTREGVAVTEVSDIQWAIPAEYIQNLLHGAATAKEVLGVDPITTPSSYMEKMTAEGMNRKPEELTLQALTEEVWTELQYMREEMRKHAPHFMNTGHEFMRYNPNFAPQYFGIGYLGREERAVQEALEADVDAVSEEKEKIAKEVLGKAYDAAGNPKPLHEVSGKMLKYLLDLHGVVWTNRGDAYRALLRGDYVSHGLKPDLNYPKVVLAIEIAVQRKLMARKAGQADRDALNADLDDIKDPVHLIRALRSVTRSYRDKEINEATETPRFKSYMDAYKDTGMRPSSAGIADAVHMFTSQALLGTMKRVMLNKMALLVTPEGSPILIPDPNTEFRGQDEMILDETWKVLAARMYAQMGETPDPQKTAKEQVSAAIQSSYGVKGSNYHHVVNSPIPSLNGFYTYVEPGENIFSSMLAGGEVAGRLKQVLGETWQDPWGVFKFFEEVNTWMKVMALQFSLFFTVAGLESLTGISGGKIWTKTKIPFAGTIAQLVEIRKQIKARDPYWMDLMYKAQRIGITFSETTNPMDLPVDILQKRVDKMSKAVAEVGGDRAGAIAKNLLSTPQLQTEIIFDSIFNTYKLWSVHHIAQREKAKADKAGVPFDFLTHVGPFAGQLDNEVGGHNAVRQAWLTPTWRRNFNLLLFSWRWSIGAWNAAGGGLLTGPVLQNYMTPEEAKHVFTRRWPAMFILVILLVPQMVQTAAYLFGMAAGDDDEDEDNDDKLFLFQNEAGRKFHADITPFVRHLPWYKGDPTGERRQYIRWGKQAFEIKRWLDDPFQAFMGKLSQLSRYGVEMATGSAAGYSDWDMPYKDMGLAGWLMDEDGQFSGSRLSYTAQKFAPFSLLAAFRQPDTSPLQILGPTSKGMSFHKAVEAYTGYLETWSRKKYYAQIYKNPRVKANLEALGPEILEAARRNGYDTKKVIDSARGAVLKDLYGRLFRAINNEDLRATEKVSAEIARLNGTVQSVRGSFENRNFLHGKPARVTPEQREAINEAFKRP